MGPTRFEWQGSPRCPDGEALAAYLDDLLTHEQRGRLEEHLADCTCCREVVAGAARLVMAEEGGRGGWRRRGRWAGVPVAALVLATVLVATLLLAAAMLRPPWLARSADAASDREEAGTRSIAPRLTNLTAWAPPSVVRRARSASDATAWSFQAAGERLQTASDGTSAERLAALGAAQLLAGDFDEAVESLRRASAGDPRRPDLLIDLGAATLARGERRGESDDVAEGLETTARALALEPRRPEARFNRALALQQLGLERAAAAAWGDYLAVERSSSWRREASERRSRLRLAPSLRWREVEGSLTEAANGSDPRRLTNLVAEHRHVARRLVQERLLPTWGVAVLANDREGQQRQLAAATAVAAAWLQATGDASLARAVQEAGSAVGARRETLASAHAALGEAADRLSAFDLPAAAAAAATATARLVEQRSAAAGWAEVLDLTCAYHLRHPALRERLAALLARRELDPSSRAAALSLLGVVHTSAGEVLAGAEAYSEARALSEDLGERERMAWTRYLLAESFTYLGDTAAAWRHRQAALALVPVLADGERRAAILIGSAAAALFEGRPHLAAALLEELLRAGPPEDPALAAELHLWRARVHLARGELAAAREDLGASSSWLQRTTPAARERLAVSLQAARGAIADDPVVAVAAYTRALAALESGGPGIWRPLLLLERGRARRRAHDPAGAIADLRAGFSAIESSDEDEAPRDPWAPRPQVIAGLADELVALELASGRHQDAFAYAERGRARSLLAVLGEGSEPSSLAAVAERLEPGVSMLVYSLAAPRPVMWRIDRGGHRLIPLLATRDELARWTRLLTAELAAGSWSDAAREAAAQLHRALIAPAGLRPGGRLVLVPDGELHELPFAALLDARGRFLVEDQALSLTPSASVHIAARSTRPRSAPADDLRGSLSALVVGNPLPDWRALPTLVPLPGAGAEAERVASLYARRRLRVGEAATRQALLAELSHHQVLHFAGHAVTNRVSPARSALALAPGGEVAGTLTAAEISRLQLGGLRVVVLSACSTGTGSLAAGEGPLSLARAFLAADVPAVVATAWPIADGGMAPLMVALHERLSRGEEPALALQAAQLALLRGPRHELRSPASWAAAELFGS